jgi:hypothetical protein
MHQHLDRLRGFLVRRRDESLADLVELDVVALEDTPSARRLARRAHIVDAEMELPAPHAHLKFRLRELENALKSVA